MLRFRSDRAMWLQPDSLDEFLRLKWKHPDARVVVGNTEVGQCVSQCSDMVSLSVAHSLIQVFIQQVVLVCVQVLR